MAFVRLKLVTDRKEQILTFGGLQWRVFFGLTWDLMYFGPKILYVICKNVMCLLSSGM